MIKQAMTALTQAASMEDLWSIHTEQMASYGFDRLIYGFSHSLTPGWLGDPDDLVILTNHPPEYSEVFFRSGLYHNAPMVRWAVENEGACSWAHMFENASDLPPRAREVLEFNQKMGVQAGYTISFKAISARSKGAIALTAKRGLGQAAVDAIWAEHGEDILLLNNVAHLKLLTLPYEGARSLTTRQREVLEWVADGKTTQDIATLLRLTAGTVEKHLRLAREALNVETTAQAVLKAAFRNQIYVLKA